jgi:hypothetical protein
VLPRYTALATADQLSWTAAEVARALEALTDANIAANQAGLVSDAASVKLAVGLRYAAEGLSGAVRGLGDTTVPDHVRLTALQRALEQLEAVMGDEIPGLGSSGGRAELQAVYASLRVAILALRLHLAPSLPPSTEFRR